MPSLVKIKIERGRDLLATDRNVSSEAATDAFVEVKLNDIVQKTSTCRKSDNPVWNEEFRFEVIDDSVLQDAPIELKCMDHDLYSSDIIGVIYIDLNPLIMRTAHGSDRDLIISGWFPLYDTTRGVRGSLQVTVKLQFIGNENPFKDSSAGVQFFSSSQLSPKCFIIQNIIGFVEDLVVDDNPENTWQDYFLKGNKSTVNDSRLKVLYNLSAEVRRELGKKVLESGGNAVLGYSMQFDTEGASGIVARAYGTACRLLKVDDSSNTVLVPLSQLEAKIPRYSLDWRTIINDSGTMVLIQKDTADFLSSRLARDISFGHSHTIGGGSHNFAAINESLVWAKCDEHQMVHFSYLFPFGSQNDKALPAGVRDNSTVSNNIARHMKMDFAGLEWANSGVNVDSNNMFQSEVQLLSLKLFPNHVRIKLGGLVLARSVKFLGKLEASVSDQETREGWWAELRDEIKSHAKVMCCKHIIGYTETCTIYGEVCILTAIGTAASLKGLSHPVNYLTHHNIGAAHKSISSENNALTPSHINRSKLGLNIYSPSSALRSSSALKAIEVNVEHDIIDNVPAIKAFPGDVENNVTDKVILARAYSSNSTVKKIEDGIDGGMFTTPLSRGGISQELPSMRRKLKPYKPCIAVHVPYNHRTAPFAFMRLVPCGICKRKWVPEIILASSEIPSSLQVQGCGQLLEARVCRMRRAGSGEIDAVKISEVLPFVEYDIQRQIILKLKIVGMNAAFGYACKIQVGTDLVIATATCTAVKLDSLPSPPSLQIVRNRDGRSQQEIRLVSLQKEIEDLTAMNRNLLEKQDAYNKSIVRLQQKSIQHLVNQNYRQFTKKSIVPSNTSVISSQIMNKVISEECEERNGSVLDSLETYSQTHTQSNPSSSSSSSTSSSSSSSSSEDDDTSNGDDSSSLESPPSTASSEENEENKYIAIEEQATIDSPTANLQREFRRNTLESMNQLKHPVKQVTQVLDRKQSTSKEQDVEVNDRRLRPKRMIYKDDRPPFVLEIDDDTDADIMAVLSDWNNPKGIEIVNTSFVPGTVEILQGNGRNISIFRRSCIVAPKSASNGYINSNPRSTAALNNSLSKLFFDSYMRLCYTVKDMIPCQILGLSHHLNISDEGMIEILVTAMVHGKVLDTKYKYSIYRDILDTTIRRRSRSRSRSNSDNNHQLSSSPQVNTTIDSNIHILTTNSLIHNSTERERRRRNSSLGSSDSGTKEIVMESLLFESLNQNSNRGNSANSGVAFDDNLTLKKMEMKLGINSTANKVLLTPLADIPNTRVKRYLGPVLLHFLKDSFASRSTIAGNVGSFYYLMISEANSVARAHVAALGGNALLCHKIIFEESTGRVSKNQSQSYSLISISGDAVLYENITINSYINNNITNNNISTTATTNTTTNNNNSIETNNIFEYGINSNNNIISDKSVNIENKRTNNTIPYPQNIDV